MSQLLESLSAIREPEDSVVTLTLDLSSPRTPQFLRQTVYQQLPAEGTSKSLDGTCRRIREFVESGLRPETRGLFLVVGETVWEPMEMKLPFRNAVFLNRTPYLAPLLEAEARAPRVYVVCMDRRGATLDALHLGAWRNLSQWRSREAVRAGTGPRDREVEDAAVEMIGDVARRVAVLDAENPSLAVLAFGPARLYRRLRERLPSGCRVLHSGALPRGEQDLCDRAAAITDWIVHDRVAQEVRQFQEQREARYLVALGPRAVLDALEAGAVARVYADPDHPAMGMKCERCRRREDEGVDLCRSCGKPLARVSFTQELVARILELHGPALTFAPRASWLSELGGMAALLRPRS